MIKKEIKSRLEIIPFLLVVESFICFLFSYTDWYKNIFAHWEQLTECSFLMCIIFYALSNEWGYVAKKSILTLLLLNGVNFIYPLLQTDSYYSIIISIIFVHYLFLISLTLCLKK